MYKKDFIKMLKEDIKIGMEMIRDAHNGCPDQEWCGNVVEGEPPCEIGSEEWYDRIEEILYIQFEGAYQYLDFLQSQGKVEDDDEEPEYDEGFEF